MNTHMIRTHFATSYVTATFHPTIGQRAHQSLTNTAKVHQAGLHIAKVHQSANPT